jgi:hypothetical protein
VDRGETLIAFHHAMATSRGEEVCSQPSFLLGEPEIRFPQVIDFKWYFENLISGSVKGGHYRNGYSRASVLELLPLHGGSSALPWSRFSV